MNAVLLDIEGTTTSISFVYDKLFPYARAQMSAWVEAAEACGELDELMPLIAADHDIEVREGNDPPPLDGSDGVSAFLLRLMDNDRKATGLKAVQGRIWSAGYADGSLQGHVYDDVPEALGRWAEREIPVYIYSSGSIAAQKLLFGASSAGDLLDLLQGHFDTTTGPKKEALSYRRIAESIGCEPSSIRFVTDSIDEARAAAEAGLQVALSVREGNAPLPPHRFQEVGSLLELVGCG